MRGQREGWEDGEGGREKDIKRERERETCHSTLLFIIVFFMTALLFCGLCGSGLWTPLTEGPS